jgi:hypothetical protein
MVPRHPGPEGSAPEHLQGSVERVTFHSPESGFCVLRVKVRGQYDLVTLVGLPGLPQGVLSLSHALACVLAILGLGDWRDRKRAGASPSLRLRLCVINTVYRIYAKGHAFSLRPAG